MQAYAMNRLARPGVLLPAIALVCVLAVCTALVSQHVFDMQPCPWCVLQRLVFLLIAAVCVVASIWRVASVRLVGGLLAGMLAFAGMGAALWQHFQAKSSASCLQTLADRIVGATGLDNRFPDVFSPRASCAEAAVDLLGIPYEFWSMALFMAIAVAGGIVVVRSRAR